MNSYRVQWTYPDGGGADDIQGEDLSDVIRQLSTQEYWQDKTALATAVTITMSYRIPE